MKLKLSNSFIEVVNKGNGSAGAILCDELKNGEEIALSSGKIPRSSPTRH